MSRAPLGGPSRQFVQMLNDGLDPITGFSEPKLETKMANPAPAPKPTNGRAPQAPLTAQGYVIAVLRARENQKPRERKLLERVIPEERAKAADLLTKLGG